MKKIYLIIVLSAITLDLKAQSGNPQITVGAGTGLVTTFSSNPAINTSNSFNGNLAFYPVQYLNIELEGQIGNLNGTVLNNGSFTNKYQAVILASNVQIGIFFNDSEKSFLDFIKNLYIGVGVGAIHNRIYALNDYPHYISPMISLKLGYEFTLIRKDDAAKLKLDLYSSYNPVLENGLYGYVGTKPSNSAYVCFGIQLKYVINLSDPSSPTF